MTQAIGVEVDCPFTLSMLRKVTYAGAKSTSFVEAAKALSALAEVNISRERVQRWTKRVGEARVAEMEAAAQSYERLPLPERQKSPALQVPQVACIQVDGGRIQIRDRSEASAERESKSHWRETLVGCCLSMTSKEHSMDPCPTIPKTFIDPRRMRELSREIKGFSSGEEEVAAATEAVPESRDCRPKVLVRSVVATRQGIETFGKRLAAAAYARGFHAARRKAFVADGLASNWSVHKKHFSHYTPVLDFTHAICYVYAAATAGRSLAEAWSEYSQWAQWLWEGATNLLIAAVGQRAQELGPPTDSDGETSPRRIVAEALQYLTNQQSRMKYAEYRKLGLPITSSHIESTIKQINRRLKGTEKFWDQGAEPMLQLAADHISETLDLDHFWIRRPSRLQPMRCYHTAA
jgi:hypothetical protein